MVKYHKISSKTGVKIRHISAPNEFASDMAFKAAKFEVAACAPMEERCNYC